MARFLSLAMIGEGPTDYQFLPPVLRQATWNMCVNDSRGEVEIPLEVVSLNSDPALRTFPERVVDAAKRNQGSFNLLFIHTDGAGDPERAYRSIVQPAIEALLTNRDLGQIWALGVVPIREMEAWAIADGNAIRSVYGTTLSDERLGIPARARDVEAVIDPKRKLLEVLDSALPKRSKRRHPVHLRAIGEQIDLAILRGIPSFQRFEADLRQTLQNAGILAT